MDHRRIEDTPLGKMIYFWPLIGGLGMLLMSIGGYIATIHYMSGSLDKGELFQTAQQSINSRLATLIETHDRRLIELEDWRNGVNDIYSNRRHH